MSKFNPLKLAERLDDYSNVLLKEGHDVEVNWFVLKDSWHRLQHSVDARWINELDPAYSKIESLSHEFRQNNLRLRSKVDSISSRLRDFDK